MQKVGPGSRGPEGVEQRSAGRRGHWVRRSLRCTADDNRKAAADSKQKSAEIAPGPSWAHRDGRFERLEGAGGGGERREDGSQAARRRERGQNPPLWELVQSSGSLIPRYRLGQGSRGYIDHFSITRPDNADLLGPKHRVDYLSTDRLKKLRNFRDAGSCLSGRDEAGNWLYSYDGGCITVSNILSFYRSDFFFFLVFVDESIGVL